MPRSRDLLSGLLLVVVTGWFLVSTGAAGGRPALLVAVVASGLAGASYILAGLDADRSVGGIRVSPRRSRSVAAAALGVSLVALGGDGLAGGLDPLSVVLLVGGVLVVAAGWLRLVSFGPFEGGRRDDGGS